MTAATNYPAIDAEKLKQIQNRKTPWRETIGTFGWALPNDGLSEILDDAHIAYQAATGCEGDTLIIGIRGEKYRRWAKAIYDGGCPHIADPDAVLPWFVLLKCAMPYPLGAGHRMMWADDLGLSDLDKPHRQRAAWKCQGESESDRDYEIRMEAAEQGESESDDDYDMRLDRDYSMEGEHQK